MAVMLAEVPTTGSVYLFVPIPQAPTRMHTCPYRSFLVVRHSEETGHISVTEAGRDFCSGSGLSVPLISGSSCYLRLNLATLYRNVKASARRSAQHDEAFTQQLHCLLHCSALKGLSSTSWLKDALEEGVLFHQAMP